ncbi:thioesterase family protein [Novosphingobium guangzhouense]|uniref:Acyl-CoA thioesterase n=1 Tax=Novosphingobium guangzhouense TaxID=1850347 RepID=A0A2K2G2L7_9SPHN|nr:thioesterase family protein [Novosphingobium guangzhouense]PNU05290.1 hypothetical protein A8V01_17085 [Novosphingobium guangzhouense]
MDGFGQMLAGAEAIDGGFALEIAEHWLQGRTAYGGLTSAIALAAAKGVCDNLAPLRSGQLSMVGPLAGRIEAKARILRQGRNATWVSAELTAGGIVGFTSTFVFMRQIESVLSIDHHPLPDGLIALDDAKPVPMDHAPAFLRNHFEARFAMPKEALGEADLAWWVRAGDRENLDPEVETLLCGDVLPVAVWPLLGFKVPISSMQWHVNMLGAKPSADGWWLIRSTSNHAAHGGASEHIMQWNAEGVPAISGMQSVAVFG